MKAMFARLATIPVAAALALTSFAWSAMTANASDYVPTQPQVSVSHCSAFWGECDVLIPMPVLEGYSGPTANVTMNLELTIVNTKRPLSKPLQPTQNLNYNVPIANGPALQLTLDAGTYSFTWKGRLDSSDPWGPSSGITEVKMGGIFGVEDPDAAPKGPLGQINVTATRIDKRTVLVTGRVSPAAGVPSIGGDSVTVRHRVRGQVGYGSVQRVSVDRNGFFSHRVTTGKKAYVTVRAGDVAGPRLVVGTKASQWVGVPLYEEISFMARSLGAPNADFHAVALQITDRFGTAVSGPEVFYVPRPGAAAIPADSMNYNNGMVQGTCQPHLSWAGPSSTTITATCTVWIGYGPRPTTTVQVGLPPVG